jgi:hypothetical protein
VTLFICNLLFLNLSIRGSHQRPLQLMSRRRSLGGRRPDPAGAVDIEFILTQKASSPSSQGQLEGTP